MWRTVEREGEGGWKWELGSPPSPACCVNSALSFVSVYLLIFWHHTSALLYGFIMPPLIGSGSQAARQARQGSDGSPRMFQMFDKRAAVLPADTTHTY